MGKEKKQRHKDEGREIMRRVEKEKKTNRQEKRKKDQEMDGEEK